MGVNFSSDVILVVSSEIHILWIVFLLHSPRNRMNANDVSNRNLLRNG